MAHKQKPTAFIHLTIPPVTTIPTNDRPNQSSTHQTQQFITRSSNTKSTYPCLQTLQATTLSHQPFTCNDLKPQQPFAHHRHRSLPNLLPSRAHEVGETPQATIIIPPTTYEALSLDPLNHHYHNLTPNSEKPSTPSKPILCRGRVLTQPHSHNHRTISTASSSINVDRSSSLKP